MATNNPNSSSAAPQAARRPAAQSKHPKKKKKPSSFLKKAFLYLLFLGFIFSAVVAVGLAFYIHRISASLPSDDEILSYEANEASIVYDRNNRVITELFIENRKPMKLHEFSKWIIMSILAAEDSEFYTHAGIRPLAILRSIMTGEKGQGASTITQQLARNLFLTSEKSLERKAKEAILTLRLEKLYTKDKLIETYLNAIYFGHGAWGIDAAAHSYFNKSASQLTLGEASILAGLVAAPEKYSPIRHLDLAKIRQNYVLNRLVRLGWVSEAEAQAAANEKLVFNERTEENKLTFNKAPYFVSHILFKELIPKYGSDKVYKSGMKIYTTLDLDLQAAAEKSMQLLKSEGGLVALAPENGAVLALVGGKNFDGTKFNRVTQAYRQTGSTFKPVVYATAIEAGYRPVDHILDKPITLRVPNSTEPEWSPHNSNNSYAGEETLLSALSHSHNTPAVRLTYMLGPNKVVDTARRMGITSPHLTPILSVGLGTTSVTPLELAVVYAVFGNGGKRVTPYFIREIRSREGKLVYSATPESETALSPETTLIVRSMLYEVVRAGTGSNAKIPGYEVYGKTGTTNDYTDAWFAGGVPGLVTVVYAGNDDLKPLGQKNATGARIALPVWSSFMKQAVKIAGSAKTFARISARVKATRICIQSGYLAGSGCRATNIYLPSNKIPASSCPVHGLGNGNETNAPQLLLLAQDKKLLEEAKSEDILPDLPPPDLLKPPAPPPLPKFPDPPLRRRPAVDPNKTTGSWRDLIKKDDRPVEERYQELLKKYNIK
jgi:penicillin-binding protein 1A